MFKPGIQCFAPDSKAAILMGVGVWGGGSTVANNHSARRVIYYLDVVSATIVRAQSEENNSNPYPSVRWSLN
jgi:hypothetical protein